MILLMGLHIYFLIALKVHIKVYSLEVHRATMKSNPNLVQYFADILL